MPLTRVFLYPLLCSCSGYSGAQLANLVNMAATVASQRGSEEICQQDIEQVSWAI